VILKDALRVQIEPEQELYHGTARRSLAATHGVRDALKDLRPTVTMLMPKSLPGTGLIRKAGLK